MKSKYLWVLGFLFFSVVGHQSMTDTKASESSQHVKVDINSGGFERCVRLANMSAYIMENRQFGTQMDVLLNELKDYPSFHPEVVAVYSTTRYLTERRQIDATERYRERVLIECVNDL